MTCRLCRSDFAGDAARAVAFFAALFAGAFLLLLALPAHAGTRGCITTIDYNGWRRECWNQDYVASRYRGRPSPYRVHYIRWPR